MLFHDLPQRFQASTIKFSEFVEKEHAAMGEGDLSRSGWVAAAQKPGLAGAVVRCSKRSSAPDCRRRGLLGAHAVDALDLECFFGGERWQQSGKPAGQHRFSRTGRTEEQDSVSARRGDFNGALGVLLSAHFADTRGARLGLGGLAFGTLEFQAAA